MQQKGLIRAIDSQLSILQRVLDGVIVIATLVLAVFLHPDDIPWTDKYTIVSISAVLLFYLLGKVNHLYRSFRIQGILEELEPLILTWVGTLVGLLVLGYTFKVTHELSRVVLGLWAVMTPFVLFAWRRILRQFLGAMRARGHNSRSVLIVGINDNALKLARNIQSMPWMGLSISGFISDAAQAGDALDQYEGEWTLVGTSEDLFRMAKGNELDVVYIALPLTEREAIDRVVNGLGDSTVSIFVVPDFELAEMMQGSWVSVGDVPTVSIIDHPGSSVESWLKRLEDLTGALLMLILFALPMWLIAVGIKLSSPGPVLYKQRRYGIRGEPITIWKFRSMRVTESDEEFRQATKQDARVTPFGGFLRRTSLDELPQLFNVLGGSMSIVGPRPHAVKHNEEFRRKIQGYMLRHKMKPGMTGLAQINGYRGETDTDEKMLQRVRYDVQYINNWSIWLDLAIILKTPLVLFQG